MRLDKFLGEAAGLTRSEAKNLIKSGKVTVNGAKALSPDNKIDENRDCVVCDGRQISYEKYVYFMLNKPAGLVSATKDESATVIDLFKGENRKNLFPVGRLDKDTVGLLLVTDDGDFSHRLMSPKKHVDKKYLVNILSPLLKSDIEKLEAGLYIGDGEETLPSKVEIIDETHIYLTICEGKYHQVKRMLEAVGNKVLKLKRVSVGKLNLDESLKEGEYRRLTPSELDLFNDNV